MVNCDYYLVYFGYNIVQQDKFTKKANAFIESQARFTNDYLLSKQIDAKKRTITLTYGGEEIPQQRIVAIKQQLKPFGLENADLQVHQGFAYLTQAQNNKDDEQSQQLNLLLQSKEAELNKLQSKLDSVQVFRKMALQVYKELKVQYTDLDSAVINPGELIKNGSSTQPVVAVILNFARRKSAAEKKKIEAWLIVRLQKENVTVIFNK